MMFHWPDFWPIFAINSHEDNSAERVAEFRFRYDEITIYGVNP